MVKKTRKAKSPPPRVPKKAHRKMPSEDLFPGLLTAEASKPEKIMPRVVQQTPAMPAKNPKVVPPTEAELEGVFADFGKPAAERTLPVPEHRALSSISINPIPKHRAPHAQPFLRSFQRSAAVVWESILHGAHELWEHFNPRHVKHRKTNWKPLAFVGGCALLFFLALWFAFHDAAAPVPASPVANKTENVSVPTSYQKVLWRGAEKLCTPEFLSLALDEVEKLGRKDGNQCAKFIGSGIDPRQCAQIRNVQFIAMQMRKFSGQSFNATCTSQDSFDATVTKTYYESFARYTKFPDASFQTPFPNVADFVVTGMPNATLVPPPPSIPCDAAQLRKWSTELESRENVAALTGIVDDSLRKLRGAVKEMRTACGK